MLRLNDSRTFTAASAASDVPSKEWTVGNYYYLKSGNKYLSLDGNKADSVVVKEITSFENVNKLLVIPLFGKLRE